MGEVSNGFAHFALRRASRNDAGGATGPNHELALVRTKEGAGVMAKPSVLPQRRAQKEQFVIAAAH